MEPGKKKKTNSLFTLWGSIFLQKHTISIIFGQQRLCGMEHFITHSLQLGAAWREFWKTRSLISVLKSKIVELSQNLKWLKQTLLATRDLWLWHTVIRCYGTAIICYRRLTAGNDYMYNISPWNKIKTLNSPLVHSEDFYVHRGVHGCDSTFDQMS